MNRLKGRFKKIFASSRPGGDSSAIVEPWLHTYYETASIADILACFRLLLGRNPNVEEWTGHRMQAGDPLKQVVKGYLTSLEFARRELTKEMPAEISVAELSEFKIYFDLNDSAVGKFVRDNNYEPEVAAVFRNLLRPGMSVLDIGANIGYFTMLSASIVGPSGHVFAVEPNHQNVKLIEASRRLNRFQQITVAPFAAASEVGILSLTTSHSTGTTSLLPDEISALLKARIVPCAAIDSLMPPDQRIDLIKIDVDGAEYRAMQGCRSLIERSRPAIISEFAPGLLPGISGIDGKQYLTWFGTQGYDVSVILPDGSVTPFGQNWDGVIQAYKERGVDHIDLLALPRSVGH